MASLPRWLRAHAEHYLMRAAQDSVADRHGAPRPRPPGSLADLVWMRLFVPVYRALPWGLRSRVLRAMPGSHRREWSSWREPPRRRDPAV